MSLQPSFGETQLRLGQQLSRDPSPTVDAKLSNCCPVLANACLIASLPSGLSFQLPQQMQCNVDQAVKQRENALLEPLAWNLHQP